MSLKSVKLVYVGRFSFVTPAEACEQFKAQFTFHIREMEPASLENGFKSTETITEQKAWWIDTDVITKVKAFCFLSGLSHKVKTTLKSQGYTVEEEDRRKNDMPKPRFDLIKHVQFRGRQAEALVTMCASRCGVVNCSTGWGKSFIIRQWALLFPTVKGIITVPAVTNARDLYDDLKDHIEGLGFVGDGECRIGSITVAVTHSLRLCDRDVAWVIIDEAHMALTSMHLDSILKFKRQKLLAFTATPDGKSDGRDPYLEAVFGPQIIHVPYEEAVASGNVVQLKVHMIRIAQGPDVTQYEGFHKKNKLGIWRNYFRNNEIANEVRRLIKEYPEAQILIMVDKTEHAFVLGQLLPEFSLAHGPVAADKLKKLGASGAFNKDTQVPCDKKKLQALKVAFSKSQVKYCIATGIWSRGVNFPDLNILVRADGQASPINSGQTPGRLSRLGTNKDKGYGLLVDCVDFFSRDLLGRSLRRAAVYKKNKFDLDEETINLLRSAGRVYRQKGGNPDSLPDEVNFDTGEDG